MAHHIRSAKTRPIPSDLAVNLPPPVVAEQPVLQQNCSRYVLATSLLKALPVLDVKSGKLLGHKQLRQHPCLKKTWDTSYTNELDCLCQGVCEGTTRLNIQHIAGTSTFRVINYNDIPENKRSDICRTRVVCEYRVDKDDPNRTRITLEGVF